MRSYTCTIRGNFNFGAPQIVNSLIAFGSVAPGFFPLPYERLILKKVKSSLYYLANGISGAIYLNHSLALVSPSTVADDLKVVTAQTQPAGGLFVANFTPQVNLDFSVDNSILDTPDYLLGQAGLLISLSPFGGQNVVIGSTIFTEINFMFEIVDVQNADFDEIWKGVNKK